MSTCFRPCQMPLDFYACYLLASYNNVHRDCTYIGFTVNPRRRLRQHNGELVAGAWFTKKRRPWQMMVCVYGFPSKVAALQFEWAWQHPLKSKLLAHRRPQFQGKIGRPHMLKAKFAILHEMLNCRPWFNFHLTVHMFHQERYEDIMGTFQTMTRKRNPSYGLPALPSHTRLVFGGFEMLDTLCGNGIDEDEVGTFTKYMEADEDQDTGSDEDDSVDVDALCSLCGKPLQPPGLRCAARHCTMKSHPVCLAEWFHDNPTDPEPEAKTLLIPAAASECPVCARVLEWPGLVRRFKDALHKEMLQTVYNRALDSAASQPALKTEPDPAEPPCDVTSGTQPQRPSQRSGACRDAASQRQRQRHGDDAQASPPSATQSRTRGRPGRVKRLKPHDSTRNAGAKGPTGSEGPVGTQHCPGDVDPPNPKRPRCDGSASRPRKRRVHFGVAEGCNANSAVFLDSDDSDTGSDGDALQNAHTGSTGCSSDNWCAITGAGDHATANGRRQEGHRDTGSNGSSSSSSKSCASKGTSGLVEGGDASDCGGTRKMGIVDSGFAVRSAALEEGCGSRSTAQAHARSCDAVGDATDRCEANAASADPVCASVRRAAAGGAQQVSGSAPECQLQSCPPDGVSCDSLNVLLEVMDEVDCLEHTHSGASLQPQAAATDCAPLAPSASGVHTTPPQKGGPSTMPSSPVYLFQHAAVKNTDLFLYDLETTGFIQQGRCPHIIEWAVYHPQSGQRFVSLINPQATITPNAMKCHHITAQMVRTAPTFDVVYGHVLEWLRKFLHRSNDPDDPAAPERVLLLIAHNGSAFDERILRQHVSDRPSLGPLPQWLLFGDSMRFFRKALSKRWYSGKYGLDCLRKLFGVPAPQTRHRADTDNRLLWRCMKGTAELLSGKEDPVALIIAFFREPRRFARACFAFYCHTEARVRRYVHPTTQHLFTFKPKAASSCLDAKSMTYGVQLALTCRLRVQQRALQRQAFHAPSSCPLAPALQAPIACGSAARLTL